MSRRLKPGKANRISLRKCPLSDKEARETHYWLRVLVASDVVEQPQLDDLDELVRILTSIVKSAQCGKGPREQ
jgi:four helix bundle protein